MLENNIVKLKRLVEANGKNPNTEYKILELEDVISKSIENGPLKLYFVSQINDILPLFKMNNKKLNDGDIIGEIVAFDDTTISFKPTYISDIGKFKDHQVRFMYDVDDVNEEAQTLKVVSIIVAYIQKESDEEMKAWLDNKEKEDNVDIENTKCIELHDNINTRDSVTIE